MLSGAPTYPLTPAELRQAYGVDDINGNPGILFSGPANADSVAGDGSGQTVAVVELGDNPDMYDSSDPNFASGDLGVFDSRFGVPNLPSFSFQKIDVDGAGSTLAPANGGESSLDVEWVHAMAPGAKIVLLESDVSLQAAVDYAIQDVPNVSVVSISYFYPTDDAEFVVPAAHQGVTFVVCSGDKGANIWYPGATPNVLAAGATTLALNSSDGSYSSESAWGVDTGTDQSGGGGISTSVPLPPYQQVVSHSPAYLDAEPTVGYAGRATPDVSIDGSPGSPVAEIDEQDYGTFAISGAGTSLSAPLWAGLIAIADQGRAELGLDPLSSDVNAVTSWTGTQPRIYSLPAADFHDIDDGTTNGTYPAIPGYDLATGLGSPIANTLIPDLAGGATVSGQVTYDTPGSPPVADKQVYLDIGNLGSQNPNDPVTTTDAEGNFMFTDVIGGATGTLGIVNPLQGEICTPDRTFTTAYGMLQTVNFTCTTGIPLAIADSANSDVYTLRISPADPAQTQVLLNGTLLYFGPTTAIKQLTVNFTGANDELIIDNTNDTYVGDVTGNDGANGVGEPVPLQFLYVNGGGAASSDTLLVIGNAGNHQFYAGNGYPGSPTYLQYDLQPDMIATNVPNLEFDFGGGTIGLGIYGPITITVPAQTPGGGILQRQLSSVSIFEGGLLNFASSAAYADRSVIVMSDDLNGGGIDLGNNDLIDQGSPDSLDFFNALLGAIAAGYADGAWNGPGINSSAAAADTTGSTGLGIILNSVDGTLAGAALFTDFDGVAVNSYSILVKYAYYGDLNLDGTVNGADFSVLVRNFGDTGADWAEGDVTYDGTVGGLDFVLLARNFGKTM